MDSKNLRGIWNTLSAKDIGCLQSFIFGKLSKNAYPPFSAILNKFSYAMCNVILIFISSEYISNSNQCIFLLTTVSQTFVQSEHTHIFNFTADWTLHIGNQILNTIKYLLNYGSCRRDSRVLRLTLSDFGIVLWERMVEGKTKAVQLVIICFMGKLLVFGANLLHIDESIAIRFREFKIICLPKSKKIIEKHN